ncbi:hypothetical protein [Hanstruepera marina]|uniref:hypothetical protein n=1 Tax=Hanstruepera marina TaxID=2873265 RepID=UPI001CA627A1|nr:hypothetical protein [Hanstruepera marina]
MKNVLYILSVFLILLSCSSDDDNTESTPQTIEPEVRILGEWKLIYIFRVSSPPNEFDYSNDEIIFDFKSNGTVTVTGNDDPSLYFTNGEYGYEFLETHHNVNGADIPYKLFKIGNRRWTGFAFDVEGDNAFDIEFFDFTFSYVDTDGPFYGFIRN